MAPRVAAANVCFDTSPPEDVRARAAVLHLHSVLVVVFAAHSRERAVSGRLNEGSVAYAALAVTWRVARKRCERDGHSVGGEEMSDLVVLDMLWHRSWGRECFDCDALVARVCL